MRDIGTKSTTGPEAILCAAVEWWLSGFDLSGIVTSALESASPSEMWSRRPEDLAVALSHRIPWDSLNLHFWRSADGVPAVRHMVETAVRSWRTGKSRGNRVQEVKSFVASLVLVAAGEMVLASGYIEEHAPEIAAARRARKRKR